MSSLACDLLMYSPRLNTWQDPRGGAQRKCRTERRDGSQQLRKMQQSESLQWDRQGGQWRMAVFLPHTFSLRPGMMRRLTSGSLTRSYASGHILSAQCCSQLHLLCGEEGYTRTLHDLHRSHALFLFMEQVCKHISVCLLRPPHDELHLDLQAGLSQLSLRL